MRQRRRLTLKQSKFRLNGQAPAAAAAMAGVDGRTEGRARGGQTEAGGTEVD